MPVDASIYGGIQQVRPANRLAQLAQVMQLEGLQNQNDMSRLKRDEYQRGVDRTNKLSALLESGADSQALRRGGFLKEANDWDKQSADTAKDRAAMEKTQLETARERVNMAGQVLGGVNDPQTYQFARQTLGKFGFPMPEQYDPAFVQAKIGEATTIAQRLEQHWKQKGYDLDVRKADETVRHNRATEANTIRGQDMVDARTRETTAATMTKPFEVTGEDGKPVLVQQDKQGNIRPVEGYLPKQGASKPLTEGQGKALLFGSRMQATEEIFDKLADKGVTTSIPGSRSGYGVGAVINALQPGERQQLDQAKRDFINAVLRRESGAVISEAEFANAEQQYFPQPGETPAQKAQKKANRELATRGILAEVPDSENRVAKIRGTAAPAKSASNIDALLDKYK